MKMPKRLAFLLGAAQLGYAAVSEYTQPLRASDCAGGLPDGCTTFTVDNVAYLAYDGSCCSCWGYLTQADSTKNQDLNLSVKGEGEASISSLLADLNTQSHANKRFGETASFDYWAEMTEEVATGEVTWATTAPTGQTGAGAAHVDGHFADGETHTATIGGNFRRVTGYAASAASFVVFADILETGVAAADLVSVDGTAALTTDEVAALTGMDNVQVGTGENKGLLGWIAKDNGDDTFTVAFKNFADNRAGRVRKYQANGVGNAERQQIQLCAPKDFNFPGEFSVFVFDFPPCAHPRADTWTTEENSNGALTAKTETDKINCRNFGRARAEGHAVADEAARTALCIFEFVVAAQRGDAALNEDDHQYVCRSVAEYAVLDSNGTRDAEKAGIWIFIVLLAVICAWPACQKWPIYKRVCNADHDFCCKNQKQQIVRQATESLMSRQSEQSSGSPKSARRPDSPNPNSGASEEAVELSASTSQPVKIGEPNVNKIPEVPNSSEG